MGELLRQVVIALFLRTAIGSQAQAHPEWFAQITASATEFSVPAPILIAIGIHESGFGSDRRTRATWGVIPRSMTRACAAGGCTGDPTRDQIHISARILRHGRDACGSWRGAVRRYLSGRCWGRPPQTRRPRRLARLLRRNYQASVAYEARVFRTVRSIDQGLVRAMSTSGSLTPPVVALR